MSRRKWVAAPVVVVLVAALFLLWQCKPEAEPTPAHGPDVETTVVPDEAGASSDPQEPPERTVRERTPPPPTEEDDANAEADTVEDVGRMLPTLIDITVTVLAEESGAPLEGVRVHVEAQGLDWEGEGRTNAEGRVDFDEVPPQELLSFRAFADGRIRAELSAPANDAELRLPLGRMIEGRVLRQVDGSPVADAEVLLAPGGSVDGMSSGTSEGLLGRTRTDASGRFRVGAAEPGEIVTVVASTPDLVPASLGLIVPQVDASPSPVELRLGPAGRIVGRVTGVDGEPLHGARVYGASLENAWILDNPESSYTGSGGVREALAANTDEEGRYELTGVPLDHPFAVVAVDALRRRSAIANGVIVTEGTPTATADLAVLERATLVVKLAADGGGSIEEEAQLQLWGASWPQTAHLMDDGRYHFSAVPAGTYSVQVAAKGWVKHVEQLELAAGELREIDITLKRGLEVHGTVVDDEGRPLPNFSISVGRPYGPEYRDLPPSEASTATDEQGRFVVSGLHPGPHRLTAYGITQENVEIELFDVPSEPLQLVSRREGSLVGRVVLPEGVDAPEELSLQIEREDGGGFGSGGSFDPDIEQIGIPVGRVTVRFRAAGFARWERTIEVAPGQRVDLGEVKLSVGVSLAGRILGADTRPLAGVTVEYGDAFSPEYQVVTTDDGGRFELHHLPEGAVEITVRPAGHLGGLRTLDPAEPDSLEVRLARGAVINGKALTPGGAPLVGGWVQAERVDGNDDLSDYADTNARGEFALRLHAGEYVFTWSDDERTLGPSAPMHFEEGSTTPLELR